MIPLISLASIGAIIEHLLKCLYFNPTSSLERLGHRWNRVRQLAKPPLRVGVRKAGQACPQRGENLVWARSDPNNIRA